MENEKAVKLNEDDLEQVAGGVSDGPLNPCYFLPTGSKKEMGGAIWLQCGARFCYGTESGCSCHGFSNCMDKWHRVYTETEELYPADYSDHALKKKSSKYEAP